MEKRQVSPANNSFIPKNPVQKHSYVKNVKRVSFPIFSILSYALLISSILSAIVVFIYGQYLSKTLEQSLVTLDANIDAFSVSAMMSVADFNNRLNAAKDLLDQHIMYPAVLNLLSSLSVQTLTYEKIEFSRTVNSNINVVATAQTQEFDAILFQREVLKDAKQLGIVSLEISDVMYVPEKTSTDAATPSGVTFKMNMVLAQEAFTLNSHNFIEDFAKEETL